MNKPVIIENFGGIAPRYGSAVKLGLATVAESCDFSDGKLGPIRSDLQEEAFVRTNEDSLCFHDGVWKKGVNAHFLRWKINDFDILIFNDGGVLKKTINGVTATLGHNPPPPPAATTKLTVNATLDSSAWMPSDINGEYYYNDGGLSEPETLKIDGKAAVKGVVGSLEVGQWGWGDNDNLGFNTIYIKPSMVVGDPGILSWTLDSEDPLFPENNVYEAAVPFSFFGEVPHLDAYNKTFTLDENNRKIYTAGIHLWIFDTFYVTDKSRDEIFNETATLSDSERYMRYISGDPNTPQFAIGMMEWELDQPNSRYFLRVKFRDSLDPRSNPRNLSFTPYLTSPAVKYGLMLNPGAGPTNLFSKTITIESQVGKINGTVRYVLTTTRNVGGFTDESGPSGVSADTICVNSKMQIQMPVITEPLVTHINVYRIGTAAEYLFVASVPVAQSSYIDNTEEADLGIAIPTEYTNDQGDLITFAKPPSGFDGIATDLLSGMVFAYRGSTLHWCEPGLPDAWPTVYTLNLRTKIKRAIPLAGAMAVLCQDGPVRVDAGDAMSVQASQVLGTEPCIGTAAVGFNQGVLYFSDSGLILFNMVGTLNFTQTWFDEDWFVQNIDPNGAILAEDNGFLYLFHSGGTLLYDSATKNWTTRSVVAFAAHRYPEDGQLYYLSATGVCRVKGGAGVTPFVYRSGDILFGDIHRKSCLEVYLSGSGTVDLEVFIDGVSTATKTIDMDAVLERSRKLMIPIHVAGRAAQIRLTGVGAVWEAQVQ